jgi:hypothetical protein
MPCNIYQVQNDINDNSFKSISQRVTGMMLQDRKRMTWLNFVLCAGPQLLPLGASLTRRAPRNENVMNEKSALLDISD